jgi:hypothetical protein
MAFATHDTVKPAKRKRPLPFGNGRFRCPSAPETYMR